jgi:hypothetical protein
MITTPGYSNTHSMFATIATDAAKTPSHRATCDRKSTPIPTSTRKIPRNREPALSRRGLPDCKDDARSAGYSRTGEPALSRRGLPDCKDDARSAGYSRTEALSLASETRLPRASSLPIRQAVLVSGPTELQPWDDD